MPALDALPQIADEVDRLRRDNTRLLEENAGLVRQVQAMQPIANAAWDVVTAAFPPRGVDRSEIGLKLELDRLKLAVLKFRGKSS